MRKLKGTFLNEYTIFSVVINIIMIYVLYEDDDFFGSVIVFLFINILLYFRVQESMNYFKYDNEKIIVSNLINPFKYREIKVFEVKLIEFRSKSYLGKHIRIELANKIFNFGISGMDKDEIEKMISFIKENMKRT